MFILKARINNHNQYNTNKKIQIMSLQHHVTPPLRTHLFYITWDTLCYVTTTKHKHPLIMTMEYKSAYQQMQNHEWLFELNKQLSKS